MAPQSKLAPTKTALVTGANRGIGRAVAAGMAAKGFQVAVASRELTAGEEVARALGEGAFAVALDVTDDDACRRVVAQVVDRTGGLHVLINNAGVALDGEFDTAELPLERFDQAIRVNLRAPLLLSQLALPHMRRAGWGRIVNVSTGMSRLGEGMGGGWPSYRITKTGLNALTRNLAAELRDVDILVNAVDPGWVKTRMGGEGAPREVDAGAETIIWAATLPKGGPSGELLKDRRPSAF
jgi:NAD(P)-dependent dehydrogenase (short-subunit alcohol dehydrogenase family)